MVVNIIKQVHSPALFLVPLSTFRATFTSTFALSIPILFIGSLYNPHRLLHDIATHAPTPQHDSSLTTVLSRAIPTLLPQFQPLVHRLVVLELIATTRRRRVGRVVPSDRLLGPGEPAWVIVCLPGITDACGRCGRVCGEVTSRAICSLDIILRAIVVGREARGGVGCGCAGVASQLRVHVAGVPGRSWESIISGGELLLRSFAI